MTLNRKDILKTLTYSRILRLLADGNYPSKVARILGISKQLMHYYCKMLLSKGYLSKSKGYPTFYTTTQTGKNFIGECERGFKGKTFRLHNIAIKYAIIVDAKAPADWNRVQLRNWGKEIGSLLGITVEKTTKNVIIYPDVVEGEDPYQLLFYAKDESDRVAGLLEDRLKMKLGRGELVRKPHFAIKDPIISEFSKNMELTTDGAKVDESEGLGEIDYLDVETAKDYVTMPSRIKNIEKNMLIFAKAMSEHLALIKSLQDVASAIKQAVMPLDLPEEIKRRKPAGVG